MLGKYNYYAGDDYALDLERARHKHEDVKLQLENKTDFCSFVYSNADAAKCREKIFSKLSEYKQVNSGGRYNNNVGGPVSSKLEFQKKNISLLLRLRIQQGVDIQQKKLYMLFQPEQYQFIGVILPLLKNLMKIVLLIAIKWGLPKRVKMR